MLLLNSTLFCLSTQMSTKFVTKIFLQIYLQIFMKSYLQFIWHKTFLVAKWFEKVYALAFSSPENSLLLSSFMRYIWPIYTLFFLASDTYGLPRSPLLLRNSKMLPCFSDNFHLSDDSLSSRSRRSLKIYPCSNNT